MLWNTLLQYGRTPKTRPWTSVQSVNFVLRTIYRTHRRPLIAVSKSILLIQDVYSGALKYLLAYYYDDASLSLALPVALSVGSAPI